MQTAIRPARMKTVEEIAKEWDLFAEARDKQLRQGLDLSFEYVLRPTVLAMALGGDFTAVLDCGCGTGVLTEVLSERSDAITGVDASSKSIAIAMAHRGSRNNIQYHATSVEEFAITRSRGSYTLGVANMVLMDAPSLEGVLVAIASLLAPSALFIATITHPFFWPLYWGYAFDPWFNYSAELSIEAPFRISLDKDVLSYTSHFHRPLGSYITAMGKAGFKLLELVEPMPSRNVEARYPDKWAYPRFLAMKCRRESSALL